MQHNADRWHRSVRCGRRLRPHSQQATHVPAGQPPSTDGAEGRPPTLHQTNKRRKYLTPILGSISTVLLFKLGRRLAAAESYTTTLQDLSQTIGGGPAVNGRSSLVNKAIARLVMFGYAQPISATTLRVRTEIPALPQRQLLRLPLELQRTIPVR